MIKTNSSGHEMRNFAIVLIVVWLIYVALGLLAPAAQSTTRYGLSLTQVNITRFTIMLPLLFIWLTALFSVVRFRHYTRLVRNAPEEEGFRKISLGLLMLLLVIIIPSLINSVASYWPDSPDVQEFSTILRNYINLGLYLVGFWYLWQGSRDLYHTIDPGLPSNSLRATLLVVVLVLVIGLSWSIFNNPFRTASADPLIRPTYYLNDSLIILTIILPHALIWLLGSLTALNLLTYARQVKGIIYRQTFSYLAYGFIVTIGLLVGLQFLSQANAALGRAAFSVILVIIYLLLLAIAVGYLLIARGAKKLTAIEEVQ